MGTIRALAHSSFQRAAVWLSNTLEFDTRMTSLELTDRCAIQPRRSGQATVTYGRTGHILTRATGFVEAYDYTLNPYSGCSFGCTYCYAAFFARKPALRDNWGYWVKVKDNAVESLRNRLNKDPQSLDGRRIYMSTVTDPYQPLDRTLQITRNLLCEMARRSCRVKLVVQTRSPDVIRDVDVYRAIVDNGGDVQVNMTVTTDDEAVRRVFEPYCPSNERRLEAIRVVAEQGVQTCITVTPLLWLNDAGGFAERLRQTGAKRFIAQSFQFGTGQFVAHTREAAHQLMAERLNRTVQEDWVTQYVHLYRLWRKELEVSLARSEYVLGEGKKGFAPPF